MLEINIFNGWLPCPEELIEKHFYKYPSDIPVTKSSSNGDPSYHNCLDRSIYRELTRLKITFQYNYLNPML